MDPKQRFSSRVDSYIRYRPGYPRGVIDRLAEACGLKPGAAVADIGSGTGLLAGLFLEFGCPVWGVEPNPEMRAAGERLLAGRAGFTSVDGTAEATGLPAGSMAFVTAGLAFHWFDPPKARAEFARILKPGGWVALVWNERRVDSTPFLRAYEALLLQYSTDYAAVNHRNVEENPQTIPAFFGGPYAVARFDNNQEFDFDGVRGRLMSSSYVPEPGQPNHTALIDGVREAFDRYQTDGRVVVEYDTRMFYGHLTG